jgi:hypothetical protein
MGIAGALSKGLIESPCPKEEHKSQPRVWAMIHVGPRIEFCYQLKVVADAKGKDVRVIIR